MKIYRDMLNEICYFEVPHNAYETEENMHKFEKLLHTILEFNLPEEVIEKAEYAIYSFCRCNNGYIIHKFKEYYAISQVLDEFYPQEISNIIKVFDKNRTYPIQEIEIKLEWKY